MSQPLGKLESVDLRLQWPHEAQNLTPWIASEGLELLGKVMQADLVLVEQEASVGPFSADILARVEGPDDHLVVIENQLEKTNHDHLGKSIVYAAGLGARTIVWIAKHFTEEHRQAIDWLNEHNDGHVSYFALELRLVRIGDSLPAPEFRVVCSPNEWAHTLRAAQTREVGQDKLELRQFWVEFIDYLESSGTKLPFKNRPPLGGWYFVSLGRPGFSLILKVGTTEGLVRCQAKIGGSDPHEAYDKILERRTEIEARLGSLEWISEFQKPVIGTSIAGSIDTPDSRRKMMEWMKSQAEAFYNTFAPIIETLDPS